MDRTTAVELFQIASEELAIHNRHLHGWAVVTVRDARGSGRSVEATSTDTNPYHADIVMGFPPGDDAKDQAIEHANDLALYASYQAPPN